MQVVVVDMTMLWIAIFKWFERVPLWVAGLAASLGLGLTGSKNLRGICTGSVMATADFCLGRQGRTRPGQTARAEMIWLP